MADGHHVIRAVLLGGVHSRLHGGVQVLALIALLEAVDILPLVVLEIGGGGLGEGLGGVDAHIGHLHLAVGQHLVGVEHGLALQVGEVGADIIVLRLVVGQGQEVVHAVVELMVAGDGQVVAHLVHDLHDGGTLGQGADGAALDGVARVDQGDVVLAVLGLHLGLVGRHARIADVGDRVVLLRLVDAAVDIVGVEDDDLLGLRLSGLHRPALLGLGALAYRRIVVLVIVFAIVRRERGDHQAEHHDQRQQQRQDLARCFHLLTFPFYFGPSRSASISEQAGLACYYTNLFRLFQP